MSEVLVKFETIVTAEDGRGFAPRACGRLRHDGLYEGWIEFVPIESGRAVIRSPRETLQPNRPDLLYWAGGLTQTYLDGALRRALQPRRLGVQPDHWEKPAFDAPATTGASRRSAAAAAGRARAVLNPYEVYQQGEDVLVQELRAFDAPRLRDIVRTYEFASDDAAQRASAEELTRMIISGVRAPRRSSMTSEEESRSSP